MHTDYYNEDGVKVPSVTTITKMLNIPELPKWANQLGKYKIDYNEYMARVAKKGTELHAAIESYWCSGDTNVADIDVRRRFSAYLEWTKTNKVELIMMEMSLTCKSFGGTFDFYGKVNDVLTLLDYKSARRPYQSMFIQLAGYMILLEENGYAVNQAGVLAIPATAKIIERYIPEVDMKEYKEIFKHALNIYYKRRKMNDIYQWGEAFE